MLRKYEGMFLFNPAVTADWESVQVELGRMFERAGARVIASAKWDERRLAYEIRGCKRGIYALTYFEADAGKIGDLSRDVELSEAAIRCLIVRVDHLTEEEMKELAAKPPVAPAPEGDRDDGYRDGYRDRRPRDGHRGERRYGRDSGGRGGSHGGPGSEPAPPVGPDVLEV